MTLNWQQRTLGHIRGLVEKLEDSVGDLLEENKSQSEQIERMRRVRERGDRLMSRASPAPPMR